jgi:hypothetical protein
MLNLTPLDRCQCAEHASIHVAQHVCQHHLFPIAFPQLTILSIHIARSFLFANCLRLVLTAFLETAHTPTWLSGFNLLPSATIALLSQSTR